MLLSGGASPVQQPSPRGRAGLRLKHGDPTPAVGCKRHKVTWDQELRGRRRLLRLPGAGEARSERLDAPAWWARQQRCLLLGLGCGGASANHCAGATRLVPPGMLLWGWCRLEAAPWCRVTVKVCHPSRVAVSSAHVSGTASHPRPDRLGKQQVAPWSHEG